MPQIRPVVLVTYQLLRKSRVWKKFISICRFKCFANDHNRKAPTTRLSSLHGRHILVANDHEESSIHHRLNPNLCSNQSKATTIRSNQCSRQSPKLKRHCRHLSSTTGATKFSLGSHSTMTTTASGLDSIDLPSLDQQQLASDFVPMSTPRFTRQTFITAGDRLQPSASASQPVSSSVSVSYQMPQPPQVAVTPTTSLSPPNGSGRSSRNSTRNADGFTTTNSSFIFLPITNNNPSNSSTRGKSRSRRHNHTNMPTGPFPILQTNHFTIEYEDDNNVSACDDDSVNQQPHELGLVWADANGQLAETSRIRYNEDDAETLQLHDVGSILDNSSSRGNQS